MMMATILHNPRCSKSREALAILEAAGAEVTVIDYLQAPPSAADLKALYARAGMPPREGLRTAETGAPALTHADADAILAPMTAAPLLSQPPQAPTNPGGVLGPPPPPGAVALYGHRQPGTARAGRKG